MTQFLTDKQMQDLENVDKKILQDNWTKLSTNNQNFFSDTYTKTKKFGGWQGQNLQNFKGYNENQIGIPGVNLIKSSPLTTPLKEDGNNNETPKTEIKGLDYVKFKDEPNGNLDLNKENFLNIYRKQARGEKLGIAEKNFLADLKFKNQFEGKSMQEIFGIETKQDKERKYQNLAMENRNLQAGDLRNTLASQGLNYDEIEKVIGYHQPYNEYLQTQNEIKSRSDEAFVKKKDLLDKQLLETTRQIQENGKQRMDVLNTGMSFSGFGRSSYALGRRDEVARSVNSEINIAQSKAQAELELYRAELQGADEKTLGSLRENLANYTNALKNQQTENAKLAQALNSEANASMAQALDNMIALSGVNENAIDKELSKELGYLVNKKGQAVNIDENGKPIMLLAGRKQTYEENKDQRDFAYNSGKDTRNFEYSVYKDERDFGLKQEEFKQKAYTDNFGLKLDIEKLGLEKEKLNYSKEKDLLDFEIKKAEKEGKISKDFIEGNQKLFDDIRADTKDFSEINRQYNIMQNAWNSYLAGDKKNRATVEQQLIMVFNKMLDPGSVVREGEFDRTAQGQAIITKYQEQVDRLTKGGAGISDETLKDLVNGAKIMFDSGKVTMMNKKDNLKANAKYLGADPSFVDSYFNREIGLTDNKTEKEIENSWNKKSLTNKEKLKLKEAFTFNKADQTAQKKEIPKKAIILGLDNTRKSGQCGAFVNDYTQKLTGKRIMGDSYQSKAKHINSKTPQIGGIAVWNPGGKYGNYGHTGIVIGTEGNNVIIKDANWKGDEKVRIRKVPIKSILNGQNGGFVNFT